MAINRDVQTALLKLSDLLSSDNTVSYKALFEEFMDEHEFGLALHVICDYLAAEGVGAINSHSLALVDCLHRDMHIEDDCIFHIEKARFQKGGILTQ